MNNYKIELGFKEVVQHVEQITVKYKLITRQLKNKEIPVRNTNYGYGLIYACYIAELCGYTEFDVIEFGVGPRPYGLIDLKLITTIINKKANTNFQINIIGFDRLEGMPESSSYKDHPEIWNKGLWGANEYTAIEAPFAKFYAGELKDTTKEYENDLRNRNSKIGFVVFDLDQYQGTKVATNILKFDSNLLFPCLPLYFDDLYNTPMMSEYTGPYLAVNEFNFSNEFRKIDLKQITQFYCTSFLQVLDHPIRTGEEKPLYPLMMDKLN